MIIFYVYIIYFFSKLPENFTCCDGKLIKIPKWDFIFARVKTGQVGT